nr:hypothetical protein RTCK_02750 [Rhizobium sp. TCK]
MRDTVLGNLSEAIPVVLATELVDTYQQLVAKHRAGDLEAALVKGGRFVEHVLRVIEFLRTGAAPSEIKQVAVTIREIEKEVTLPESLRILIPKAANVIYNIRSKRNAIHVKEIDPTAIDVSLAVATAGWILAELLRLYHCSEDKAVADAMLALTRASIPLIEAINGETIVGQTVPAKNEVLLLLAHAKPLGMSRSEIGIAAKCSQASVSKVLKELMGKRLVHQARDARYFITSAGEQLLEQWVRNRLVSGT